MNIELTHIFVKVVQTGSFSKAAEYLKLPRSSVSRGITKLEKSTGTKLIVRTTRSLHLTEAGRNFFESCLPAVLTIEDAHKSLEGKESTISGLVRITAPEDVGISMIIPALSELSSKHPDLQFEFCFTDSVVDLVKEGFDIAVRMGKRKDSSHHLKEAGEIYFIAVAAPEYLSRVEEILHPEDLSLHRCMGHFWSKTWSMNSGNNSSAISVKPMIQGNYMQGFVNLALSGTGISFVPKFLCDQHLKSGKLVHVLPDWKSAPVLVSILTTISPSSSMRIKTTVDAIRRAINSSI